MAAYIYQGPPENPRTVFKNSFPVITDIRPKFFMDYSVNTNPSTLLLLTRVGMRNVDTIQYFLTFDDVVGYFYFGKGIGSLELGGMMFTDASNTFPGLRTLFEKIIGANRGKVVPVSFGSFVFNCVIGEHTINMDSENGYGEFSINMSIIDHNLPSKKPNSSVC